MPLKTCHTFLIKFVKESRERCLGSEEHLLGVSGPEWLSQEGSALAWDRPRGRGLQDKVGGDPFEDAALWPWLAQWLERLPMHRGLGVRAGGDRSMFLSRVGREGEEKLPRSLPPSLLRGASSPETASPDARL